MDSSYLGCEIKRISVLTENVAQPGSDAPWGHLRQPQDLNFRSKHAPPPEHLAETAIDDAHDEVQPPEFWEQRWTIRISPQTRRAGGCLGMASSGGAGREGV